MDCILKCDMKTSIDIEAYLPAATKVLQEQNAPAFRTKQVYEALAHRHVADWDEVTNLPAALKSALADEVPARSLQSRRVSEASDGTRKYLFTTAEGYLIETVMIPEKDRRTVCISTQVGCAMGCTFCATGQLGMKKNLRAREIAEQVFAVAQDIAPDRISNVVVMGMGEPMNNYRQTLLALRALNDERGLNLGARSIAVSTSGLVDKIRRFADEPEQFHLAISLHTPFERQRRELMPIAARHSISELMRSAQYYVETTHRKLFFEYTLLAGVNDTPDHAAALGELLDHRLYHLNMLRFNWTDTGYAATSKPDAKQFLLRCRENGLSATLRPSRGEDIDAACGQLAAKDGGGREAVALR